MLTTIIAVVTLIVLVIALAFTNISLNARLRERQRTWSRLLRKRVVNVANIKSPSCERIAAAVSALETLSAVAGGDAALSRVTGVDITRVADRLDEAFVVGDGEDKEK